ncbi:MAG TPA: family 20 glycosylhydrolase [Candidatus Eremiobacteraceae bacterium]|nr:family 20 glycosylhydrolase [Candidatus Eremiobacteraceae bacterium]
MRMQPIVLALAVASSGVSARAIAADAPVSSPQVIPLPRHVEYGAGVYVVPSFIAVAAGDADERNVGSSLVAYLNASGVSAALREGRGSGRTNFQLSDRANDASLGREGYRLTVDQTGISIEANGGAGLFYGMQTLEQIAPPSALHGRALQFVRITDWPEYRWRGIHLDVSRHFFPVPVVERYIDLAARYKLNEFHWHLTDDQGWRIEIKRYPRLALIGGCRDGTQVGGEGSTETDHKKYCGYYTQAQIRAVVAYAKARYVTILPEIEMPGHSVAAVAAYPWLGCDGRRHPVRELWGVSTEILCPTDRTFVFVDDVLREVASLFPGEYVHIGGDEVPKDSWRASGVVAALMRREHIMTYDAVQGYFTRRVEQIAAKYHKHIIGWDEILDGGVTRSAVVMAWQSAQRGVLAVKRGNDAIMTPDGQLYLDAAQGNQDYEPLSIGGLLTTKMVYDYDPLPPGLSPAQTGHILGAQANLWAEYVPSSDHLFYMLLPRELALAELCWTPRTRMNWYDFTQRMGPELARLEAGGYHYRIPDVTFTLIADSVEFPEQQPVENEVDVAVNGVATVSLNEIAPGATIHYTLDGSPPSATAAVYAKPLQLQVPSGQTIVVGAIAVLADGRVGPPAFTHISNRGAQP